MSDRRFLPLKALAAAGLAAWVLAVPRTATAGPGNYDPKTKTFNLTYVYARLPGLGAVGEPMQPTAEQQQNVEALFADVSRKLEVITAGRGKLGRLTQVDNVARADVVFDLASSGERPAYAYKKCLGGSQGQVLFYYQYFATRAGVDREGTVNTGVHELCHYFFGLPDEYPDASDNASDRHCPGPTGPACLMELYWSRPWYQRPCDDDHNRRVTSGGLRYPMSCKALIDDFFAQHGVTSGDTADPSTGVSPSAQPDTEQAKLESIISTTTGEVRKRKRNFTGTLDELRKIARGLVASGLKQQNLNRTEKEVGNAVSVIMKAVSFAAMDPTERFRTIAKLLRDTAVRIAKSSQAKDAASKIAEVETELFNLAVANAPEPEKPFSKEDADFLENLARQAVAAPDDSNQPKNSAELNYQMIRYLYEAVRDLSSDSNPAIALAMTENLQNLDKLGRDFKLPVPFKPRFGHRRTMIIAPDPRIGAYDLVPLQSGIFHFTRIRDRYLGQFAALVQRNQIQLNSVDLRQPVETGIDDATGGLLSSSRPATFFTPTPATGTSATAPAPTVNLQQLLAKVVEEIRKDQLENVAILIPPGGLGPEVNDLLKAFRKQLLIRTSDVRLDVVVVGAQEVPSLLLDLCHRSGGVVLTIMDVQETGAIAQRLKNEESSGSWVAFPRVYEMHCGTQVEIDASNPKLNNERKKDQDQFFKEAMKKLCLFDKDGKKIEKPNPNDPLDPVLRIRSKVLEVDDQIVKLVELTEKTKGKGPNKKTVLGPDNKPVPWPDDEVIHTTLTTIQEEYREVRKELVDLVPIVQLVKGQFERILEIKDRPKFEVPDEPPVLPVLEQRAAMRVIDDIARGKDILMKVERDYRGKLRQQVRDLKALIDVDPAKKAWLGEQLAKLAGSDDETTGGSANDLYKDIYVTLRVIERGISEVLQPVNLRFDVETFQDQIQSLDPDMPASMKTKNRIPFYGEEDAEFEIVVGLSHFPPFAIPSPDALAKFGDKELVAVQLLDEQGNPSPEGDSLILDKSSPKTMRVYRMGPRQGRRSQWYQLSVVPNNDFAAKLLDDTVRYTVSIASLRPNVQLNTGIRYPTDPASELKPRRPEETDADVEQQERSWNQLRGTFSALLPGPIVEVQVYGGTPILRAQVRGVYSVLGKSNPLNRFPSLEFKDDGKYPDRNENDGVYTAQINLDGTPPGGADYRIGIQAFANKATNRQTENISLEVADEEAHKRSEENFNAGKKSDAGEPQDRPALEFQRATSLHFRAEK